MALKKSPSRDSGDSDSEELPTFAFLKKEPSSTKRRQPEREEKIVVVDISDSEASCPPTPGLLSPPVSDTAETVPQTQPVRLLSSESEEEEEEFIPLAQRLTCKFLTYKQPSPEDSSSPIKSVLDHQNNEGVSCDWKKQPFPKIPEVPLHDTPERSAADNKDLILDPCRQLPTYPSTCPGQSSSLVVTKANSDILPPQKKTKQSQKVQGRGSQGCRQQRQARQKGSILRRQERKNAALVTRMKAQRPEECLKHVIVVLDPGPHMYPCPLLSYLLSGPPTDSPFSICCSAFTDGRWGPAPGSTAVHAVPLCDRGAGRALQCHLEEKGWAI